MRESIESEDVRSEQAEPATLVPGTDPRQLLLRVSEAAQVLGICRSTVYELLYAGRIPSVKIGNARRIRQSDLEAFVRDLVEVS